MKFYYKNVKVGYVAAIVCDDHITEGYDEKFCQELFESRIHETITDLRLMQTLLATEPGPREKVKTPCLKTTLVNS